MADLIEKKVEATPQQASRIYETSGIRMAYDVLDKLEKQFPALPGLAMACHAVKALESDARVGLASIALRAAAKAGIDINAAENIFTIPEKDGRVFFIANWAGDGKGGE